ncbi:MAG: TetR family transcriptional regulator [Microthrixaceae bacterium]
MTATVSTLTKGEQTRQTILDAAIVRFGRDGYRASSVADIARDAGVGGTVAYAYFENKESLFLAALDTDAAAVINEGVLHLLDEDRIEWQETLVLALIDAIEQHPLAKRVLSGLEPHATDRVIEIPALNGLRRTVAARLRGQQQTGIVRTDVDPDALADGSVGIILSVLMAVLQFGPMAISTFGPGIVAMFDAALLPPEA